MKQFTVRMMSFCENERRLVEISDNDFQSVKGKLEDTLDLIYHYGQNDFQPRNLPSVSVGDVIELNDELHFVAMSGFEKITETQFQEYAKMDRQDRAFCGYGKGLEKLGK